MRRIVKLNPYTYTFAVGKIRAKETLLLKEKDFQQMINLDFFEALQFLSRNRFYGERVIQLDNIEKIENFLREKKETQDSLLGELIKEKKFFEIIKQLLNFPEELSKEKDFFGSGFLKNYFRHYIDLLNIKRLFSLKEKKDFLEGGFISDKVFKELENKNEEEILRFFKNTKYADIVEEGLLYYKKEGTFLYLETLMRSFLIEFLKPQKYNPFGVEPVIAYYLAYINELNLVRFILIGKLLGLEKEILNKGLSKTYV